MSLVCVVIVPSASVTRLSIPDIAVALAATPVVELFTVLLKDEISLLFVLIEPSADVTRESSPLTAVAVAATPVVE